MKKRPEIIVFIIALVILSSVWFVPRVLEMTSNGGAGSNSQPVITMAKFRQISEGDSYAKVVKIFGSPGIEGETSFYPESANSAPVERKTYTWQNNNGSNVFVVFENDKLIIKKDSGLK